MYILATFPYGVHTHPILFVTSLFIDYIPYGLYTIKFGSVQYSLVQFRTASKI